MSQAVISSNQSLKVNRAISVATTVNSNCMAIVNYKVSFPGVYTGISFSDRYAVAIDGVKTLYFGPGQSVPNTFTSSSVAFLDSNSGNTTVSNVDVTWTIFNGVELVNSP